MGRNISERNAKIILLRAEGRTLTNLSLHFGLSRSRVDQIFKMEKRKELLIKQGEGIRKNIREANDLNVKIPMDDLFCSLSLPIQLGFRLKTHFISKGLQELSLTEFMNFLIPDIVIFRGLYQTIPAYRANHVGVISYVKIIKGINKVEDDLGVAFKDEWTRRKKRLKESLIAIKYPAPYLMRGEDAAI